MSITVIIHEATRTGAPRIGGLIVRELGRKEPVDAIVLKDGPLEDWIVECAEGAPVTVFRNDEFFWRVPFETRLKAAKTALLESDSDIVYVNSLAASIFVFAAKALGRKVILHVHEKAADMVNLLRHDIVKMDAVNLADGVILAAEDQADDIREVFKTDAGGFRNFGIAVDFDAVRAAAREPSTPAQNARGEAFVRRDRLVVGMCGHASLRKGVDTFYSTAKALPECDFLWIGGWGPEETADNAIFDAFVEDRLPNVYVSGSVANPYPYMGAFDIFFLSSREDPNPVVLAEAMTLDVPLLCFSETTGVTDRLGRSAILCYGSPNVEDAARVIKTFTPEKARSPEFRGLADMFLPAFDLREKMVMVSEMIAELRQPSTT